MTPSRPLEVGSLAVTVAGATAVGGPAGFAVAVLGGAVWYAWGVAFAVATLWVAGAALPPVTLATLGAGSLLLVLATLAQEDRISAGVGLVVAVLLGGVSLGSAQVVGPATATGITLVVLALASYGLHRYELVTLDLVPAGERA